MGQRWILSMTRTRRSADFESAGRTASSGLLALGTLAGLKSAIQQTGGMRYTCDP